MIPYWASTKAVAGMTRCYVGYECCLVGFVYSGDMDDELPLCWYCGEGKGEKLIPLNSGMDHPVYSMCKVQPSGRLD